MINIFVCEFKLGITKQLTNVRKNKLILYARNGSPILT